MKSNVEKKLSLKGMLCDHDLLMEEGREDIQQIYAEEAETSLGEARDAVSKTDAQWLGRINWTGAWKLVLP